MSRIQFRIPLIHFTAVNMISTAASAPIRPAPTVARAGKSLPNASRYDAFMSLNLRHVRQIDDAVDDVLPVVAGGLQRPADARQRLRRSAP